MLKKILQEMSTGNVRSRADLARRLGVSEGLLAQMMEDLARKGYLAPLTAALDCGGCSRCNGRKVCNGCGSSEATMPKGWALTVKGIETAKRYSQ